jgi:hypothetical protein
MNATLSSLARAAALVLAAGAGLAQAQSAGYTGTERAATSAVIYPAKGQSARQQDRDRYDCHDWARQQTGYDPSQPAPAAAAAPSSSGGGAPPSGAMARGALRGAAVGELVNHDAGRGAAVGVLGSAVVERAQARQTEQARQQQAAQQQAARSQQRSKYERAFGACMEGRGYVLK